MQDDSTIMAKTQEELQDMVNRLVDIGRKYDMEININKSQVMRELKDIDHSTYLGSVLTRDGYCTREIEIIVIAKGPFINYVRVPRKGGLENLYILLLWGGESNPFLSNIFQVDILY